MYCDVGEWSVRWGLRGRGGGEGRGLGPDIEPVQGSVGGGEGEPVIRETELKRWWVVAATGESVGGGSRWGYGASRSVQGGGSVDDTVGVG